RMKPFAGAGNQDDFNACRSQHGQVFEQLGEMWSVQYRVIDLQHDGLAVEPILVIKDFADQVDLLPVLDLVHALTLAGIRRRVYCRRGLRERFVPKSMRKNAQS